MSDGYIPSEIKMFQEAMRLRKLGIYTMRDIAGKLGVQRLALIEALGVWVDAGSPGATLPEPTGFDEIDAATGDKT